MSRFKMAGAIRQSSPGCCTEMMSVLSTKVGPVISQRVGPEAKEITSPASGSLGRNEEQPVIAKYTDKVADVARGGVIDVCRIVGKPIGESVV
jgi:hypothetical protein